MNSRDPLLELWQRAQQREVRAFEQLRISCRSLVRGEIRKLVYGIQEDDIAELEQIVWTEVYKALSNFRGDAKVSTWLVGVTRNLSYNWMRSHKSEQQAVVCSIEDTQDQQPREDEMIRHIVLQDAIKNLPEKLRIVIELIYLEQLTDDEAAQRLNLPLGTVKSRKRAGLKGLRITMRGEEGAP